MCICKDDFRSTVLASLDELKVITTKNCHGVIVRKRAEWSGKGGKSCSHILKTHSGQGLENAKRTGEVNILTELLLSSLTSIFA